MNNPESIEIIRRFYEAIDWLIANKVIRGKQTFTNRYNINRWNFNTVRQKPESDMFQLVWISHLIKDFGVSAEWIMTGKGCMFATEPSIRLGSKTRKRIQINPSLSFARKSDENESR
jgi:hypothetical protein